MAIFNTTNIETENEYPNVTGTLESSAEILYEFNAGINKVLGAAYVADIMIESAVSEGATNVEVLVESSVKDMAKKAREWFEEFFKKIEVWFKRLYLTIADRTKIISAFSKKHGKEALHNFDNYTGEKATISGHNYKVGADQTLIIKATEFNNSLKTNVEKNDYANADELLTEYTIDKFKEDLHKDIFGQGKPVDFPEMTIKREYVVEAEKVCSGSDNIIKSIKRLEKETKDSIKKSINELKKHESEKEEAAVVSKAIRVNKTLVSRLQSINNIFISEYQKILAQNYKILKKAYSLKPEKEKKEKATESSIFESAYSLV